MTVNKLCEKIEKTLVAIEKYQKLNEKKLQAFPYEIDNITSALMDFLFNLKLKKYEIDMIFTVHYNEIWNENNLEVAEEYAKKFTDELTKELQNISSGSLYDTLPKVESEIKVKEMER